MFLDESHVTIAQLGGMYNGDRARKENLVDYGFRLPSALDNRPLQVRGVRDARCARRSSSRRRRPTTSSTHAGQVVEQVVRPTGLVDPQVDVRPAAHAGRRPAVGDHACASTKNERVLVTTLTKRMAEELTDYLAEHGVKVRYLHSRHRHGGAGRDHPRPAPGRVRRAGRHQPAARGPRHSRRCRWSRSSTPTRKASCAPSAR